MVVKLEQNLSVDEIEIVIKYAQMNKDVERIAAMLQSLNTRIKCSQDGRDKYINLSDIYYFESVDRRTFAYCKQDVYKTELRLYQIVEDFAHLGFVQISKSYVLNINVLDSITPLFNSRMEATLDNGERLFITRKYLENIKQALQGGGMQA
ncbi:MAG: LytTR family transcriptional regulator DNA-binding domain-containing protein [Defluviitaleaceae bacterium]|nr:LytTR family transcriptional regulator DNA-binding domain-containing protein [Defluviitaleaceae bacterium]